MLRFVSCLLFCCSYFIGLSQTNIKPFASHNQAPLIHSYGLPNTEGGKIVEKGKFSMSSIFNLSSNSTNALFQNEIVYFDGEMARLDLNAKYGIAERFEIGLNLPFVNHSSGFMDSSIDGFHSALGLSGGARGVTPKGEMHYVYSRDGIILFNIDEPSFGIGDISFELGLKLLEHKTHSMALRAYLKLNNADKKKLLGSGTVDFSFQFSGQTTGVGPRPAYFFYSLGYLRVGKGSLLEDMQSRNVTFASLGLAVKATSLFVPKVQFDYHSKFFKNSMTEELGDSGLQLLLGADFILNENLILTGGFSEDIKINTSPDFLLHLALNYTF
ncbi:DUF3187 family protein [Ancylomarina sp. 16SWW S1-10-2]|uniref:DUF3187 family protein n=1 Tax=Ancylomarina sp. 16SWW S1-10-2 TaxID=2499681 RepID=UPI0012AEA66B|nr:DUF3187 family protein [Ancylomarina sp. 16SWW S1-10-2]MRT93860.1 DUF3187 family protein [Ancylomarina sp. 16SWW S1-10-2]